MEGDTILLQDIFKYRLMSRAVGEPASARANGELVATGLRPKFLDKLTEEGIPVPAKVFRSAPPPSVSSGRGGSNGRLRTMKVPAVTALVDPERAR